MQLPLSYKHKVYFCCHRLHPSPPVCSVTVSGCTSIIHFSTCQLTKSAVRSFKMQLFQSITSYGCLVLLSSPEKNPDRPLNVWVCRKNGSLVRGVHLLRKAEHQPFLLTLCLSEDSGGSSEPSDHHHMWPWSRETDRQEEEGELWLLVGKYKMKQWA